ncbi:hypothetical protein Z043_104465, partial [Scleropages formosus]
LSTSSSAPPAEQAPRTTRTSERRGAVNGKGSGYRPPLPHKPRVPPKPPHLQNPVKERSSPRGLFCLLRDSSDTKCWSSLWRLVELKKDGSPQKSKTLTGSPARRNIQKQQGTRQGSGISPATRQDADRQTSNGALVQMDGCERTSPLEGTEDPNIGTDKLVNGDINTEPSSRARTERRLSKEDAVETHHL